MRIFLRRFLLIVIFVLLSIGAYVGYQGWKYELFKTPTYDTQAPALPPAVHSTRILVFSKTNSFRHIEAIPAVNIMFKAWAKKHNWDLVVSENAAIHQTELLAQFDLIVWNNVTGDVLTIAQRAALKNHMQAGGRFLGLHGTGGNREYQWTWFPEQLIKAHFTGHPMFPQFRDGILLREDSSHPAMAHMPKTKQWHEEWYSFTESPRSRDVNVLLSVDEASYDVPQSLRMGKDHPLIWHHKLGAGTVFYSSLGHLAQAYQDDDYQRLLEQASLWLLQQ